MTCGQARQASGPLCRHHTQAGRMAQRGILSAGPAARPRRSTSCCMRPISEQAWFCQFAQLACLQGPDRRNMRSGRGPTDWRISSVRGMGVGMLATAPSAPMKPMICASAESPVVLGQIEGVRSGGFTVSPRISGGERQPPAWASDQGDAWGRARAADPARAAGRRAPACDRARREACSRCWAPC